MKKIGLVIVVLCAVMTGGRLFADQVPGSQYFFLGNGISFFPLGGSGVAHFDGMETNLYNPAGYADTKRITTDLSVGGLAGDNLLLDFRGSFPTNYGIITGNFLMLSSPGGNTAGDVVGFKGTFSKLINDEWLFGFGMNLGFANGGPSRDFAASLDVGAIYRQAVDGTGFGFFDYSLGAALRNVGKNISYSGYDSFPPLGLDMGGRLEFVRAGFYKSRVSSHLLIPMNPLHAIYGLGLENVFFDVVNLKAGLNLGVEDISPFSAGVDVNFDIKDTGIQVSYSLLPVKWGGEDVITHNAGVSIAFGTYDKKAPEVKAQAQTEYISPNFDGVNDLETLDIGVKDNTMVFGWKLDITDESGNQVKSYVAPDVRKIRHMTLGKFVKRIFAKKQEVEIPKTIEWNGEDSAGNRVEDGTYYYTMTAWDENDNKTVTERKRVVVDTKIPSVEAESEMFLFSPNGDGAKDTLAVALRSADIDPQDKIVLRITDVKSKNTVLEKTFEGIVPDRYVWDGKDVNGSAVPEGIYDFSIAASDPAGNQTSSLVKGITVRTEYEKISVSPSLRAFSPNGDGFYDMNDLRLFSSSREGLLSWNLALLDKDEKAVRELTGEKNFPDIVTFDGKDRAGKTLPDGLYSVRFKLAFESGNHPETFFKYIKIDNTPPKIDVSVNLAAFSPNGDGVKDTVSLMHKIGAGEGDVFEANIVNAAGGTFKTFNFGTNPPEVVVWDGLGDGNVQPVDGSYTYVIVGKDDVGNSAMAEAGPVKLVTGFEQVSVEPTEYAISPNGDKVKDTVTFKLGTDNRQGIVEWKLDVKDNAGSVVRSFNHRNMGPQLPAEVLWDGKSTTGDAVKDGIYTASFSMLYDTGNNPISKPKDIRIDTQGPSVEVHVDDKYLSPNDDGVKETLTIYERIRGEPDDLYSARFTDSAGRAVREFSWKGNPPAEIVWEGKGGTGKLLPEGVYNYVITGKDAAGNSVEKRIPGIVLITSYEKASATGDLGGISPNGDGAFDRIEITTSISSTKDLETWYLGFYDAQGKPVRVVKGTGVPPVKIQWDGKDDKAAAVPDGIYFYTLGLSYKSGNRPMSETGKVIVDVTPPGYNFVVAPALFSPDGDGEADTFYMNTELGDVNGVRDWKVAVYRKWNGKIDRSVPFKVFSGKGPVKQILEWDGYSDPLTMPSSFKPPEDISYKKLNGDWAVLVDSASEYAVELTARDNLNNGVQVQRDFGTDILVIPTALGLKIMINSIQFEYNKADLLPASFDILRRLIEKIEKFPNYEVGIAGHTDWIGSDEYNQELSERRAMAVYKYLVEQDVDKERLSTQGFGESQPIDDNETESGRARNRRVEFYLTKKS
jgi:outer membrane protein OmpA-like peptidoglycan-associated protein/flagellar hook assembly protein FlgD